MFAVLMSKKLLWFIPILAIALFAGCGSPAEAPLAEAEPEVPRMMKIENSLAVDGYAEGYPGSPFNLSGVEVHLAHDGTNFYVHARAASEGWIAVGFNQKGGGMDGANMVLGFVDERGKGVVRNDLGRGTGHAELDVPGMVGAIALQEDGFMYLEFSYPMVFPDQGSFKIDGLESNQVYSLIAAVNVRTDNLTSVHSSRGQIDFQVE
jgi:hypothetical protein